MATESSNPTAVASPEPTRPDDLMNMYEEMFKHRYTEGDEEYMKTTSSPLAPPPCVTGWFTRRRNDGGRRGGRGDSRNWRGGHGHQQNWNRGDGGHHYGNQGHGSYQDRQYGSQGQYGGDYHSYRNPQQRYRE